MDGVSAAFDVEKILQEMSPNASAAEAFARGFGSGGVALISDGTSMIKSAANQIGQYFHLIRGGGHGLLNQIKVDASVVIGGMADTVKLAKLAIDFAGREAANGSEFLVAMLSGDEKTKEELGGRYGDAWSMAVEVMQVCFQQVRDMEPRRQQVILGRVCFEVFSSFNPASKIGFAGKLGKADFLTNLMGRSSFKKKTVSGLTEKATEVRESIRRLHAGKWCFLAGTMIATAHGSVPIEDIQPGDLVTARHETTLEQSAKPVVQLFQNWATLVYLVAVDADLDGDADETFRVTGEHPLYVLGTGFVPAKLLSSGAVLSTAEFEVARVTSVSRERAPPGSRFRTYNFEVADYHTYFIGKSEVWVHNLCKPKLDRMVSAQDARLQAKLRRGMSYRDAWRESFNETVGAITSGVNAGKFDSKEVPEILGYVLAKGADDMPTDLQLLRNAWDDAVEGVRRHKYPGDRDLNDDLITANKGNAFNDLMIAYYRVQGGSSEVPIRGVLGGIQRIDSYIPDELIVERKYWQDLADMNKLPDRLDQIQRFALKVDDAIVQSAKHVDEDIPGAVGRALNGALVLEVPIQTPGFSCPPGMLNILGNLGIRLQDVAGNVLFDP